MSGILHHLPDEKDPVGVAHAFKEAMSSGSYLSVSNFLDDDHPRAKEAERSITGNFGTGRFRTWEEQRPFFEGLGLVEPGLVYANDCARTRTPRSTAPGTRFTAAASAVSRDRADRMTRPAWPR
jgi:hypothetical protein